MNVILSDAEAAAIEVLSRHIVAPGTRCPTCHRRVNKPRQETSPTDVKKIKGGELPSERADAVDEGLDALQEFVGADPASYPRGSLVEALTALGAQHREELRAYFKGES